MEEKSIGLAVGTEGGVYGKNAITEGLYSRPMAGDPGFSENPGGGGNAPRFQERFRPVDLSVRTGEEFAMAFSPYMVNSGGIRPEGNNNNINNHQSVMYWVPSVRKVPVVEGEVNQGYGYDAGLTGTGAQMVQSANSNCEGGNVGAEFGGGYQYRENPRAAQGFPPGNEGDPQFDDGSTSRHGHTDYPSDDVSGSQKVKFMCSFGGRILPRPSDGALRYVGGETRIISVNMGIGFAELRQKIIEVYGQALSLKYQLPNEELDALVSVSSDEDLENMMDEYQRVVEGSGDGASRLRLFLFSASDADLTHLATMSDRRHSEQCYVDAVNGITEMVFRKCGDSSVSVSSQNLEILMGLDAAGNSELGGMSSPLPSKLMPQNDVNSGAQLPTSSKQGIASVPSITSPTSPLLSSVPTHNNKQSGLGDSSVFLAEQQANVSGYSYAPFRQPEGGGGYHESDYMVPLSSAAVFHNDPHAAGSRREPESPIHKRIDKKRIDKQREKFDVSHPTTNFRSDGMQPHLDPHYTDLQQPTPSMYWPQHVNAQLDTYRYFQHTNADGGPAQQPFQPHSLQGAHLKNDLYGGSYPDKQASTHLQGHVGSAPASLQPIPAPQSPQFVRQQIPLDQQHMQMHHPLNASFLEQPSYGTRLHYYDPSIRALHRVPVPSQYQGRGYQQFVRQQNQLPYPEEQLIQQRVISHAHSDNVHAMYGGIPVSQSHHADGSVRSAPSNVTENLLQDVVMSLGDHQGMTDRGGHHGGLRGKEFQPVVSGQQGYTIPRSPMEYVVEVPSSSYIHEKQDEVKYGLQHRTKELNFDVASRGRMAHSETKQEEKSAELSGSHLVPATTSGLELSENPYGLSSDSYHTYQQSEKRETFEPTQFKQVVTPGEVGTIGILPDSLQATRMTARMNEATVTSSGINAKEVRVANILQEPTVVDKVSSANSLLSAADQQSIEQRLREVTLNSCVPRTKGENFISSEMSTTWWNGNFGADCATLDTSHMQSGELVEHHSQDGKSESGYSDIPDAVAQSDSSSNLICITEQHPGRILGERPSDDVSGHLSFMLPDDISKSSNKSKESVLNSPSVTQPENLPLQYTMQGQEKNIIDDDSGHSVLHILSNTSSLDKAKDGNLQSATATLLVGKSESDLVKNNLSVKNVATSKLTEPSNNLSPISNASVSTSAQATEEGTCLEEDSAKDVCSIGLSSPVLPLSDVKAEDDGTEGELQNVAKDASSSPIQPPVCHDPTQCVHEWNHAIEDEKAQGDVSERKMLNGTEDEMTTNAESFLEEIKNLDYDRDDSDAVIREAMILGLQTIKNADLEELRELGSGTFGTVYHGKWRGSDVAIKRIKNSCFVGKPSEQERLRSDFWREAQMLAQLHHPNVVAFYGVVSDGPGGTLATVTEYMVNGSLKQVLQKKEKYRGIDKRKRLIISMDAAFGMEYLHGKNIVHFDLKCENLLVNMRDPQRPICKVGDLGLSKIKRQTLVSGGVRGTLPWMAPELLNGSSNMVSEKVDVFSFGIVMWELLTGDEPYANMHYGAIIGGIVSNTLRPPIPSDCDPAWKFLMERCWSADPSARPTFTEITNLLRSMAASLPPKGQAHHGHVPPHPQN